MRLLDPHRASRSQALASTKRIRHRDVSDKQRVVRDVSVDPISPRQRTGQIIGIEAELSKCRRLHLEASHYLSGRERHRLRHPVPRCDPAPSAGTQYRTQAADRIMMARLIIMEPESIS